MKNNGSDGDNCIDVIRADVSLLSAGIVEGPNVRIYCTSSGERPSEALPNGSAVRSSSASPDGGGWCMQIRGGKRATTPMFASATLDRAQMSELRELIDNALGDALCRVGCGECESCKKQNAASKAAYDKAHPIVGKLVQLLPMTPKARGWAKAYTHSELHVARMIERVGESFTVQAPDGRRATFGAQEATWVEHKGAASAFDTRKRAARARKGSLR